VPGPFGKARAAAASYMKTAGLAYHPPTTYVKVDPERAGKVAQAFENMKHDPTDPKVKASYEALSKETMAQYEAVKATGLKVEFIKDGQENPYEKTPRGVEFDVTENNHMWVYPTSSGFGSGDETSQAAIRENPLLKPTGEKIGDHEVLVNDAFRIVHDYFGHIKEGLGFRAEGEDNAWRSHAAMFSNAALPSMTTETRGQNSWVNYGPHGNTNRHAKEGETVFAPQKIGLLPEWVWEDGRVKWKSILGTVFGK